MSSENQSNNNNFFDSRTIIAVAVVLVLFFGWQKYLERKYPDYYKQKAAPVSAPAPAAGTASAPAPEPAPVKSGETKAAVTDGSPENTVPLSIGDWNFQVSSKGMALKNLTLNNYKDREQKPVQLGLSSAHGLYEIGVVGQTETLNFKLEKIADNVVKGTARVGATTIEQTLTFKPDNSFASQVAVLHPDAAFKGLTVLLAEEKRLAKDSTFFLPSIEHQEFAVRHQDSLDRVNASSKKEAVDKSFGQVSMVAVGSQYFASALVDKSQILPEVDVKAPIQGELAAQLTYKPATLSDRMELQWIGYAGPKSLSQMRSVDPAFEDIVNFGFFSPIGKILLICLKWFHSFIGNWGLAIILMTLLVRAVVLPFNIASYKSMRKMTKIQPLLASLRERYKDDPTAMNRETMAVMREQKVNPIGGCLPMLLQMPVFFAFYQVLGQSIELYQAPFFLWIQDLSMKDPFFILPILVSATMYAQQKITPTTMDPSQAKILQWMPVLFGVFTVSVPAGLTLYIFTSTLFAVIQQQLFMRDRNARPASTTAVASAK